mgnify:CR=1 FL=1
MATKKTLKTPPPADELDPKELVAMALSGLTLNAQALGFLSDRWWDTKTRRLSADKVAAALKVEEEQLNAVIIAQLRSQDITGIGGKTVRVGLASDDQPHVKDWPAYYAYILSENDFSLLERRPGRAAIKERWEDGKSIPGVEKFPVYKLTKQEVK